MKNYFVCALMTSWSCLSFAEAKDTLGKNICGVISTETQKWLKEQSTVEITKLYSDGGVPPNEIYRGKNIVVNVRDQGDATLSVDVLKYKNNKLDSILATLQFTSGEFVSLGIPAQDLKVVCNLKDATSKKTPK